MDAGAKEKGKEKDEASTFSSAECCWFQTSYGWCCFLLVSFWYKATNFVPFRSGKKGNERSCQEEEKEGEQGRLPGEKMNTSGSGWLFRGFVGDEQLPNYVRIIVNPYQTTSISWKVSKSFFLFLFFVRGPMESGKSFLFFFRGSQWIKLIQRIHVRKKTNSKRPPENRLKPKRRWIIFQPSIFRVVFCC